MSKTKAEQLGMPFGTASARLRKILLFECLKKLKENVCFKCRGAIVSVAELSIEHKKPWLHVDSRLFWCLENIAYSHLGCNRPDRYSKGPEVTKNNIPGMHWCYRHKKLLPIENFNKDSYQHDGVRQLCKECQHYYRKIPTPV